MEIFIDEALSQGARARLRQELRVLAENPKSTSGELRGKRIFVKFGSKTVANAASRRRAALWLAGLLKRTVGELNYHLENTDKWEE